MVDLELYPRNDDDDNSKFFQFLLDSRVPNEKKKLQFEADVGKLFDETHYNSPTLCSGLESTMSVSFNASSDLNSLSFDHSLNHDNHSLLNSTTHEGKFPSAYSFHTKRPNLLRNAVRNNSIKSSYLKAQENIVCKSKNGTTIKGDKTFQFIIKSSSKRLYRAMKRTKESRYVLLASIKSNKQSVCARSLLLKQSKFKYNK